MSKQEFKVNTSNVLQVMQGVIELIKGGGDFRMTIFRWREKRSLSQNAMFHAQMTELSEYLVSKGRQDCTPEWCKLMMKWKFLGQEDVEVVDVETGERKVIQQIRHSSKLDAGEMTHFITQYLAWAIDIGCTLTLPNDSEYMRLMQEGNY